MGFLLEINIRLGGEVTVTVTVVESQVVFAFVLGGAGRESAIGDSDLTRRLQKIGWQCGHANITIKVSVTFWCRRGKGASASVSGDVT